MQKIKMRFNKIIIRLKEIRTQDVLFKLSPIYKYTVFF